MRNVCEYVTRICEHVTRICEFNFYLGVLEVMRKRGDKWGQDDLRRCVGYLPKPEDPDQRPGRERWPTQATR
jgi:hypothetical protein